MYNLDLSLTIPRAHAQQGVKQSRYLTSSVRTRKELLKQLKYAVMRSEKGIITRLLLFFKVIALITRYTISGSYIQILSFHSSYYS